VVLLTTLERCFQLYQWHRINWHIEYSKILRALIFITEHCWKLLNIKTKKMTTELMFFVFFDFEIYVGGLSILI
jgi:hypothetical protein